MDKNYQIILQIVNHIILNCPVLTPSIQKIVDEQYTEHALSRDGSAYNERATLERYVELLQATSGYVVDIAASDGITQSSTLGLFKREGWKGLAVEMDPEKFSQLARTYSRFSGSALARCRVTPNNVVSLLSAYEVPHDFTVLNLDIDSYDLYVIDRLLSGGFRPKVITMEINEKIPTSIYFTVDYHDEHFWRGDHFYGCSIDAAAQTVKKYGYRLVRLEFNNAFFVHDDAPPIFGPDLTPKQAYKAGYLDREDRRQLFPYNKNVDHWLYLKTFDALNEIDQYFARYRGMYTLRETPM